MKKFLKVLLFAAILSSTIISLWPWTASAQPYLLGTDGWAGCYSEYWIMTGRTILVYWDCPEGGYGESCSRQCAPFTKYCNSEDFYCGVWVTY